MDSMNATYVLNESLLDDVEVDEVVDGDDVDEDALTIKFSFDSDRETIIFIVGFFSNLSRRKIIDDRWVPECSDNGRKFHIKCKIKQDKFDIDLFLKILAYCLSFITKHNSHVTISEFGQIDFDGAYFSIGNKDKNNNVLCINNIIQLHKMFPDCNGITVMRKFVHCAVEYGIINSISDVDNIYKIYTYTPASGDDTGKLIMNIVKYDGHVIFSGDDCYHNERYSSGWLKVYNKTSNGGRVNYIDNEGNFLSADGYSYGNAFDSNGNACVKKSVGDCFLIDSKGNRITDDSFYEIELDKKGFYYARTLKNRIVILNSDGKNIFGEKDFGSYKTINNGFGWVYVDDENGKGFTLIDADGNFLYPEKTFDNVFAQDDVDGIWRVVNNGEWNYFSKSGELLLERWVTRCMDFCNGYARVYLGNGYNYIDTIGNILCRFPDNGKPHNFSMCYDFDAGGNAMVVDNGLYNFIDTQGNAISSKWFVYEDSYKYDYPDGLAFEEDFVKVKIDDNKYSMLGRNGKLLSKTGFDYIDSVFKNGYVAVKVAGYYDVIDKKGKRLLGIKRCKEYKLKRVLEFINGVAEVWSSDGLKNYIKTDGNFVSTEWFNEVGAFCGDVCEVIKMKTQDMENVDFHNFLRKDGTLVFDKWFDSENNPAYAIRQFEDCIIVSSDSYENNVVLPDGRLLFSYSVMDPIVRVDDAIFRVGSDVYVNRSGQYVSLI